MDQMQALNVNFDAAETSVPSQDLSEKDIAKTLSLLLARMARQYGGDCTLNELRVMNAVSVRGLNRALCSPSLIARDTGIPKSTISRSLASLVSKGWLIEHKDPDDRRRRIIELSDEALQERAEEPTAINDFLEKSDS